MTLQQNGKKHTYVSNGSRSNQQNLHSPVTLVLQHIVLIPLWRDDKHGHLEVVVARMVLNTGFPKSHDSTHLPPQVIPELPSAKKSPMANL